MTDSAESTANSGITFSTVASALHRQAWQHGRPPPPLTREQAREHYSALCQHINHISQTTIGLGKLCSGLELLEALLQTSSEPDSFFAQGIVGILSPMRQELHRAAQALNATIAEGHPPASAPGGAA